MRKLFFNFKNAFLVFLFSASSALADIATPAIGQPLEGFQSTVPQTPSTLAEMACIVTKLSLSFIPYIVVIAVGAFLQGLIKYVGHGDDEEKRSEGIKMMIYGTLGFFFIVSVWSVLRLTANSFGLGLFVPQFNSGGDKFTCS